LQIGEAIIEVTTEPHLRYSRFMARFARNAACFVYSDVGKSLNLKRNRAPFLQAS
jgi:hypothetical protein